MTKWNKIIITIFIKRKSNDLLSKDKEVNKNKKVIIDKKIIAFGLWEITKFCLTLILITSHIISTYIYPETS